MKHRTARSIRTTPWTAGDVLSEARKRSRGRDIAQTRAALAVLLVEAGWTHGEFLRLLLHDVARRALTDASTVETTPRARSAVLGRRVGRAA